ncbi:complex I subunit 4 family protein [Microbacter margulisiae]|uniref:NADH-quinone oxidoreductase subunit M n=1 Tax=Microbacter margulisiae TaxID=1350067 RepID=A0A7W5DNQ0_9PORP|nr:NADH-quinone oxidoreductase subunit M [Microbacter margulisiae]MBB3186297.1 NADH-quinone oxidoreductase subunit M [Microbacter margulisiae]
MIIVLLIILPLITSLFLFTGKAGQQSKTVAFVASLIVFVIAMLGGYDVWAAPGTGLVANLNLEQIMGLNIALKMDALSVLFVILTTLLVPIILASTDRNKRRPASFFALIMLMQSALVGVFTASDMILFYIFWEFALLPIFFITARWGGENSRRISIKFLIYTVIGSFFMLVAILYLYTLTPAPHSFSFDSFYQLHIPYAAQIPLFLAFFLAFAIKIPLFPFHSWQVETYNASPVQGSMLLAGIMLKMGLYGIVRFLIPLCHDVVANGSLYVLPIILFGVIYGAIIAINQPNLKKLIAFASLAHVGIIALGLLSNNAYGIEGGILQMFSHGVNIVGFFLCYYIIVKRTKTDNISQLGGIARVAPRFATIFMIILLANVALPLTNSFVGEFLILLGLFTYNKVLAVIAGLTIILGAVYMLKMYQRIMYGEKKPSTENFSDLTLKETLLFVPIIFSVFLVGIYPSFILQMLQGVVK